MIDLDAIEARCAAATPGPWRQCGADRKGCACGMVWSEPADFVVAQGEEGERAGTVCGFDVDDETISANMRFVAHAREDVPALLAEVRRLTPNHEAHGQALALVARLVEEHNSLAAERDAAFQRAVTLALGCNDFSGGHSGEMLDAFWHGIGTVVNVLRDAAAGGGSFALRSVEAVGARIEREGQP